MRKLAPLILFIILAILCAVLLACRDSVTAETKIVSRAEFTTVKVELSRFAVRSNSWTMSKDGNSFPPLDTVSESFVCETAASCDESGQACADSSRGDTIHLSKWVTTSEGDPNSGYFNVDQNREIVVAAADFERHLFSSVTVSTFGYESDRSSQRSISREYSLVLKDVPFTIQSDGSLIARLTGGELSGKIARYSYSYSNQSPRGSDNTARHFHAILPETVLTITVKK